MAYEGLGEIIGVIIVCGVFAVFMLIIQAYNYSDLNYFNRACKSFTPPKNMQYVRFEGYSSCIFESDPNLQYYRCSYQIRETNLHGYQIISSTCPSEELKGEKK